MSLLNSILQIRKKRDNSTSKYLNLQRPISPYRFQLSENLAGDDYFEQSPRPEGFDPSTLAKRFLGGYKVKLKKGTKRITLFRFLLAKLLYEAEGEGLHLDEFAVLVNLFYDLLDDQDPTFRRKYATDLERLVPLFSDLGKVRSFPIRISIESATMTSLVNWCGPILPTKNSYYGLRGNRDIRNSFVISFGDTLEPIKRRQLRYVGVGYRDKGTCRNNATDGSPCWKEVGSETAQLERALDELESSIPNLEEVVVDHDSSAKTG